MRHIGTSEITLGSIGNSHIYLRNFFHRFPADVIGGTLAFKTPGSKARTIWPSFMAGPNNGEGRPSLSAQRNADSVAGRATLASTSLRPMSSRWP